VDRSWPGNQSDPGWKPFGIYPYHTIPGGPCQHNEDCVASLCGQWSNNSTRDSIGADALDGRGTKIWNW
jgi:hypothetical protein